MEKEIISKYQEAGRVWKNVIGLARKKTKEGILLFELAEEIEGAIRSEKAEPGFPINLSINEEAAHFTPKWNDTYALKESDVLKIDIGVSVEGYICDGAITINLDNKHAKQIEANELALENALKIIGFGKSPSLIGKEIEDTLKAKGFEPIYNLGGHGLERFEIHGYPNIPNHYKKGLEELEEGAIAIEPFASTGKGNVGESPNVEIFGFAEKKLLRNPHARKLMSFVDKYQGLPFAERWLRKESGLSEFEVTIALRELLKSQAFQGFPGLKEEKNTIVTQAEKSVLVLEDKTIVLGE